MTLRDATKTGLRAARENFLPGLMLQALMGFFLAAYLLHDGTRVLLARVGESREEMGYLFSLVTYLVSGAVLPELLRVVFFQRGRATLSNLWSILTAAPCWGIMGVVVDFFYRCQIVWFGAENTWTVVLLKVLVDQFLYSPFFANPASPATSPCARATSAAKLSTTFSAAPSLPSDGFPSKSPAGACGYRV